MPWRLLREVHSSALHPFTNGHPLCHPKTTCTKALRCPCAHTSWQTTRLASGSGRGALAAHPQERARIHGRCYPFPSTFRDILTFSTRCCSPQQKSASATAPVGGPAIVIRPETCCHILRSPFVLTQLCFVSATGMGSVEQASRCAPFDSFFNSHR